LNKLQPRRKKINLDNKTGCGIAQEYCLREWALQYGGLSYPVVVRRAKSAAEIDTRSTTFDLLITLIMRKFFFRTPPK
jgi:hypothetical protein